MTETETQFDWDAYYLDTRKLSPEARGAWMDCLYHMRREQPRGRISEPLSVYATMFGSTILKTQRVLDEIADRRVADRVNEVDGNVTIINRRMFREWQITDDAKERQRRHRNKTVTEPEVNKDGVLEDCHGIVTNGDKNASYSSSEKEVIKEEKEKKIKRRVASTRIPDPFPITSEMFEWANLNCPGLALETAHESFIEYWTNNTTAKANKVDWILTWRKGMKLALKWQQERQIRSSVGKSTGEVIFIPEPPCDICGKELCLSNHYEERAA